MTTKSITIDGIEYVPKGSDAKAPAKSLKGMKYVIVRTYSAGVFAGYLEKREGEECTLLNARRLWQWSGAASLSQLAIDGTSNPTACKFPCETNTHDLLGVIEVIECTQKAKDSIASVAIWSV